MRTAGIGPALAVLRIIPPSSTIVFSLGPTLVAGNRRSAMRNEDRHRQRCLSAPLSNTLVSGRQVLPGSPCRCGTQRGADATSFKSLCISKRFSDFVHGSTATAEHSTNIRPTAFGADFTRIGHGRQVCIQPHSAIPSLYRSSQTWLSAACCFANDGLQSRILSIEPGIHDAKSHVPIDSGHRSEPRCA